MKGVRLTGHRTRDVTLIVERKWCYMRAVKDIYGRSRIGRTYLLVSRNAPSDVYSGRCHELGT